MPGSSRGTPGGGPFDARREWPAHPRRLLIAHAVFDTMVPCWLARENRVQMLRQAFAGRAHIPGRVRGELRGLARGSAGVSDLLDPTPFAKEHTLDRSGAIRAATLQAAWHGASVIQAEPNRDRGEAEALELCAQNPGWVLVSQDSNAIHHAKITNVPVFAAPDVLIVFAAQGLCLPQGAWRVYQMMVARGMYPSRFWPDDPTSEARFLALVPELAKIP
ncbi:MAG: hypothetical protein ACLQBX_17030 [Candidatus Limnocylindrales bacterium]